MRKERAIWPEASRIRVYEPNPGAPIPTLCVQCDDYPCVKSCPFNALSIDESTGAIIVNPEKCTVRGYCREAFCNCFGFILVYMVYMNCFIFLLFRILISSEGELEVGEALSTRDVGSPGVPLNAPKPDENPSGMLGNRDEAMKSNHINKYKS